MGIGAALLNYITLSWKVLDLLHKLATQKQFHVNIIVYYHTHYLHKHYINRDTLTTLHAWLQIHIIKIFQIRYWTLILVKGLQKYQRSKLEVEKTSTGLAPGRRRISLKSSRVGNFYSTSNFDLMIFLQPLDLQGCAVSCLKDLINICLENESQGYGMTFNMIYVCSKYPYFIS